MRTLIDLQKRNPVKRAAILCLLTWAPLLILSIVEHPASDGTLPFAYNLGVHFRFLVGLPLMILAEKPLSLRLAKVIDHFSSARLIVQAQNEAFDDSVDRARKLMNSRWIEISLLAIVIAYLVILSPSPNSISDAWLQWVGLPLFQFVSLRWLWRLIAWSYLLWRISRIPLALVPIHPDRCGGLRFLNISYAPWGAVSFSLSVVLCSEIASAILFRGKSLNEYQGNIFVALGLLIGLFLAPNLAFVPMLHRLRASGLLQYSVLGERYADAFQEKWVDTPAEKEIQTKEILGSNDIQALADLRNSFEVIQRLNPFLIDVMGLKSIVLPTVLPVLPLILLEIPLRQLITQVLGFVFR